MAIHSFEQIAGGLSAMTQSSVGGNNRKREFKLRSHERASPITTIWSAERLQIRTFRLGSERKKRVLKAQLIEGVAYKEVAPRRKSEGSKVTPTFPLLKRSLI